MEYLDSELIISEVRKHPIIYDTTHDDYNNRELKKSAWIKVSMNVVGEKWQEMDAAAKSEVGKEVQRRWKSMKDSLLKSVKSEGRERGKRRRPYVHLKQMGFLLALTDNRENPGKIKKGHQNTPTSSESPEDVAQETSTARSSRVLKRRKSDSFEREIVNDSRTSSHQQATSLDPDEMFLMSQLPLIKRIKPSDKIDFQIRFMELLRSYTFPNLSESRIVYDTAAPVNPETEEADEEYE